MKKIIFTLAKKAMTFASPQKAKVVTKVVAKEFLTHASVAKATELMKDKFQEVDKYLTHEKANMQNLRQNYVRNQTEQPKVSMKSIKWATANAYGKLRSFNIKGIYSEVRSKVTEIKEQTQSEFHDSPQQSETNNSSTITPNYFSSQGQQDNAQGSPADRNSTIPFDSVQADYASSNLKSNLDKLLGKSDGFSSPFTRFKNRILWKIAFFFGFLVFCHSFAKHLALSVGRNKNIEDFLKSHNAIRESQGLPPVNFKASHNLK
jgi:hypothetical protein